MKALREALPRVALAIFVAIVAGVAFAANNQTLAHIAGAASAMIFGYAVGLAIEKKPWRKTVVPDFEPIEVVSTVTKEGVSNRTPFVEEHVRWPAVERIVCLEYGIVFKSNRTQWYVPRSAFADMSEMRAAYTKITDLMNAYSKPGT